MLVHSPLPLCKAGSTLDRAFPWINQQEVDLLTCILCYDHSRYWQKTGKGYSEGKEKNMLAKFPIVGEEGDAGIACWDVFSCVLASDGACRRGREDMWLVKSWGSAEYTALRLPRLAHNCCSICSPATFS
jgi:hypothetical protein